MAATVTNCATCGDLFAARWPGEESGTCWSCLGLDITVLAREGRQVAEVESVSGQPDTTPARSGAASPIPVAQNGHSTPTPALLDALLEL